MALVVRCPSCGTEFDPPSHAKVKAQIAGAGAVGGAIAGAAVGAGYGIAGGGVASAATVPAGIAGGLILGLGARRGADWALAYVDCPDCSHRFALDPEGTPKVAERINDLRQQNGGLFGAAKKAAKLTKDHLNNLRRDVVEEVWKGDSHEEPHPGESGTPGEGPGQG